MAIEFVCQGCGKRFRVDDRLAGRRSRCTHCGERTQIPGERTHAHLAAEEASEPVAQVVVQASAPVAEFRLAPATEGDDPDLAAAARLLARHEQARTAPVRPPVEELDIELMPLEPDALDHVHSHPGVQQASGSGRGQHDLREFEQGHAPQVAQALLEDAAREDQPGPYTLGRDFVPPPEYRAHGRAAGPLVVAWRQGFDLILRLLRWVNDFAYLISVPFIASILFGFALGNRSMVHIGAVGVLLANLGRFWVDLAYVVIRPFKDGLLRVAEFLLLPVYISRHWGIMKPGVVRLAGSSLAILIVVLAYSFLPSINPHINPNASLSEKVREGVRELDQEVREDIDKVEKGVEALERKIEGGIPGASGGSIPTTKAKEADQP